MHLSKRTFYAEQYPHVPKPESRLSPRLIAAQWVANDIYAERMPRIAADLLEAGYDTPALRLLAGEMQAQCRADVEELAGKAFRELGVPYPVTEVQANLIVTRQIAREVIAGDRDVSRAGNCIEIGIWRQNAATADLKTLFALNDEITWDADYQRYMPIIDKDMLDTYARIASMTDEQIFSV